MTEESRTQAREAAADIANRVQAGKITSLRGLKACRERTDLSQKKAAMLCGVVHQTFQFWEAGRTWPTAYHLPLIASVLGCSIEDLYLGPDRDPGGGPT